MLTQLGVDPTSATNNNHSSALFTLGEIYCYGHATYGMIFCKYVRVEDADLAAGNVVQVASADGFEVSKDISGGSSIANTVAGVALAAITDGNYGFIQCGGIGAVALVTDGNVAAGDVLMAPGAADGAVAEVTITSTDPTVAQILALLGGRLGVALAADSSTTLAAGAWKMDRLIL
jgi:hypothetical protein